MQKIKIVSLVMIVLLIGLSYYYYYLVAELQQMQKTIDELRTENAGWINQNNYLGSENYNLSNTINELRVTINELNFSLYQRDFYVEYIFDREKIAQLEDSVNELNATLMSLQDENAQFYEQELTNLTIYISTDFNATAGEKLQVWNMSLTVGEPFLFTRPINGTLDITQNTTLIGSFLVPHLEGTLATFNLTFSLSFPSENSTNQTDVVVVVGIWGTRTYKVLLDKPFVVLYARVP